MRTSGSENDLPRRGGEGYEAKTAKTPNFPAPFFFPLGRDILAAEEKS
jgi:hypothetical protein